MIFRDMKWWRSYTLYDTVITNDDNNKNSDYNQEYNSKRDIKGTWEGDKEKDILMKDTNEWILCEYSVSICLRTNDKELYPEPMNK